MGSHIGGKMPAMLIDARQYLHNIPNENQLPGLNETASNIQPATPLTFPAECKHHYRLIGMHVTWGWLDIPCKLLYCSCEYLHSAFLVRQRLWLVYLGGCWRNRRPIGGGRLRGRRVGACTRSKTSRRVCNAIVNLRRVSVIVAHNVSYGMSVRPGPTSGERCKLRYTRCY